MRLLVFCLGSPVQCADSDFHSFNDLAWAESEDNTRGVIAGALENGSLDLWDADKLLSGARFVVPSLCAVGLKY